MKLFISWSGERSKLLAQGLYNWLPSVIQAVEPWISSNDIDPGARWSPELASQLEATKYGIICITSDNLYAPWLLFEAGALSKYVEQSRVVPLILDLKPADIKGPLAQFQAVQATEDEIKKLVIAINLTVAESGEKGMNTAHMDEAYKLWWPKLKQTILSIPRAIEGLQKSERSEREMIEEILLLVRKMSNEPEQASQPPNSSEPTLTNLDILSRTYDFLSEEERKKVLKMFLDYYNKGSTNS